MSVDREDVNEIVDMVINNQRIEKEIYEELQRSEMSEYFQGQILRTVLKNNPEYRISPFSITIQIMNMDTQHKRKKRIMLMNGGVLFGSHKYCNHHSLDLPSFGFVLIPLVHKETEEKEVAIVNMGSKYSVQNMGSFNLNHNLSKTDLFTNSFYCKNLFISLVKIH